MPDETLKNRIELGIKVVAPLLDLLLAVSDRLGRLAGGPELEPLPQHIRLDGGRARRSLPPRTVT